MPKQSAPSASRISRRARRFSRLSPAVVVLSLLLLFSVFLAWPSPHSWHTLGPNHGRIRWVETRVDAVIQPPLAPDWVRDLHRRGWRWPTDLPLQPLPASFGADPSGKPQPVSWLLIQSAHPTQELWFLDKRSVRITDKRGKEVSWPGGTGSVLADAERRLQFLYVGVPQELSGSGARIQFRLSRFDGVTTDLVTLPF